MSSFDRIHKAGAKTYRERRKPSWHQGGFLEKKKDYKVRAADHHQKELALKRLRLKALDKNPNEFHFHMINSKIDNGVHLEKRKDDIPLSRDQYKLFLTQDLNYIQMKCRTEEKKIEKLKSTVQLIDLELEGDKKNKHIIFIDKDSESEDSDSEETQTKNKPNKNQKVASHSASTSSAQSLSHGKKLAISSADVIRIQEARREALAKLALRCKRLKHLKAIRDKMIAQRNLAATKGMPKRLVKPGDRYSAPQFEWKRERKR